MAEEDIYKNKQSYERRMQKLDQLATPPEDGGGVIGRRRYHCRNPANLEYFKMLHQIFESLDMSYIRRGRLFDVLLFLTSATDKDLADCDREDVDRIVARGHKAHLTPASKGTFLKALKWIWKKLFPELDERGRVDDTLVPYPVRHISCRIDKSKQRRRNDKLTLEEFKRIVEYFGSDARMQAYITLAVESLGRPQEICYTRIRDLELFDNYAKVWISSHGKEGTGFLQCLDSYPYLLKWYEEHPFKSDDDAFLFLSRSRDRRQLTPTNINKKLRTACANLRIEKRITAYSLKRNGVTFRRLRGDSDVEIQHAARWMSTKQLSTYDLSSADDAFQKRLSKLGVIPSTKEDSMKLESKACICGGLVGFADRVCHRCRRVVDSKLADADQKAEGQIRELLLKALENPTRSLAELMGECGSQKLAHGSSRLLAGQPENP